MSGLVTSVIGLPEFGVVENMGVAVGTASSSLSVQKLFLRLFPYVDFRVFFRYFATSGQSKREAVTLSCRAFI